MHPPSSDTTIEIQVDTARMNIQSSSNEGRIVNDDDVVMESVADENKDPLEKLRKRNPRK